MRTLLLLLLTSLIFISCKKGDDVRQTTSSRLKTYIEDASDVPGIGRIDTFNITYDSQGRRSTVTSPNSDLNFIYTYNSNNSFNFEIKEGSHVNIAETVFLNSNSLLDSTFQVNDTQDSMTEKYIYNAQEKLIEVRQYDYSSGISTLFNKSNYTYDANGNAVTRTETDGSGSTTEIVTATYTNYPSGVYTPLSLPGHPVISNFLVASESHFIPPSNTEIVTYNYTFDSDNRLSTETVGSGGYSIVRKYIYE